jgi:hypothetical protein
MIGKYILPWFGSSPGVWTTCLLFFQLILLAGYSFAHLVVSRLSNRRQAVVHMILLAAVLFLLPVTPSESWKSLEQGDPGGRILLLLLVCVGGPFFVLSSTAPLLQAWFARIHPGKSPYRLYAISNIGSLLALLSYPLVTERYLYLQAQTRAWSAGFVLFAILCGICAWRLRNVTTVESPDPPEPPEDEVKQQEPENVKPQKHIRKGRRRGSRNQPVNRTGEAGEGTAPSHPAEPRVSTRFGVMMWLALPACGSIILMATTNHLCQDVAVVPFLWVLPLSLYLLSFAICFDNPRWYSRKLFCTLMPVGILAVCYALYRHDLMALNHQVFIYSSALFVCCMCCHGELFRLRPPPQRLTLFYLMVSLGGALGGIFVTILSPMVFNGYWEYGIGLIACYILVMFNLGREQLCRYPAAVHTEMITPGFWKSVLVTVAVGISVMLLLKFNPDQFSEFWRFEGRIFVITLPLTFLVGYEILRRTANDPDLKSRGMQRPGFLLTGLSCSILAACFSAALGWSLYRESEPLIDRTRGFHGVIRVNELDADKPRLHKYKFRYGRVVHGFQYRLPEKRTWPTAYFGVESGAGISILYHPQRPVPDRQFRIGVVGQGAGTLATYANEQVYMQTNQKQISDYFRFYELNPQVIDVADRYFTFTRDARERGADIEVLAGDGRIILERLLAEGKAQAFDVLLMDAFSGGAIPIHLLTRESFDIYWKHLKPDGILVINASHNYLRLGPVVRKAGEIFGKEVRYITFAGDRLGNAPSTFLLSTSNQKFLNSDKVVKYFSPPDPNEPAPILWTDDYSSLYPLLR